MSTTYADPAAPRGTERYQRCESCGSPMDAQQRYCVNCAARRADVDNPAARYLAAASRRAPRAAAPTTANRSVRGAAVILLLLLPVAVGIGVVVGRGNNDQPDNSALLQALHSAGTGLASGSAGAGAGAAGSALASNSSGPLTSDWTLPKGYTVELQTLPSASTDQAAADQAKKSAEAKGATNVGIISPSDFTTTPDLGAQNYVLYSGEFKQKGQAEAALKKLRSKFSGAQVIQVTKAGGSTNSGSSASGANAGGQTVAQTTHGAVHQVTGIKPTKSDQNQGAAIAQREANQTGGNYIKSQQNLPDVIAVGGTPGSAPPPTGSQP